MNLKNADEYTALVLAAAAGHVNITNILVSNETTDIEATNKFGKNAVIMASENGYLEVLKVLNEKHADFNILSKNFDNDIINIINYFEKTHTDFDMIFLGNYILDFIYYDIKIFDNIYKPSTTLNITLEGYIINNKSAKKIYSEIDYIYAPIDLIFKNLRDSNKIITYVINPALTTQNRELKSIIG
jgi:ankyrin repeat protein